MKKSLSVLGIALTVRVLALGETEGLPEIRGLVDEDYDAGFALTKIGTGEEFDFSAPVGAEVHDDWWKFGAARDWFRLSSVGGSEGGWSFAFGESNVESMVVFSYGTVRPSMTDLSTFISPFEATVGIVPETNHVKLPETDRPSCFWRTVTASNSLVMTWQNVLYERQISRPMSFQVEILRSGSMVFRYDLSRLKAEELSGVTVGVMNGGKGRRFSRLAADTTSLKWTRLDPKLKGIPDPDEDGITTSDELLLYGTDPCSADSDDDGVGDCEEIFTLKSDPTDRYSINGLFSDGLAVKLGDCDPFSCPQGSSQTYFERVFYSGSVEEETAVPASDEVAAVLEVTSCGDGIGELLIDGREIPVFPGMPSLKVAVVRGRRQSLALRGEEGLSASLSSKDFCIGELNEGMKDSWVAFPATEASHPCIHTREGNTVSVGLDPGSGFDELCCDWEAGHGISVSATSRLSAELTLDIPRNSKADVVYRLWDPRYLFGNTTFRQVCEYCPKYKDYPGYFATEDYTRYCAPYWCVCYEDCGGCRCSCHLYDDVEQESGYPGACGEHGVPYSICREYHIAEYDRVTKGQLPSGEVLKLHFPLRAEDHRKIKVTVPDGKVRCCACPDHWKNCVSIYEKGFRVAVHDEDGPFASTVEDCELDVFALTASKDFGDSTVSLSKTIEIYETHHYTVLGVGICSDDVSLDTLNELDPDFGMPVTLETNIEEGVTLKLRTDVGLKTGSVRMAFEDATANMQLWMRVWDEESGEERYELMLDTESRPSRTMSIGEWRRLASHATFDCATDTVLLSRSEGGATLCFGYAAEDDGKGFSDECRRRFTTVPPPLLPDRNRDGVIDAEDAALTVDGRFRFWVNDDIWSGDNGLSDGFYKKLTGNDWSHNGDDTKVNGRSDLVNQLPLAVNVKSLLDHWSGHRIEVTCEGDGSIVRRCYADTFWSEAKASVLKDVLGDDEDDGGYCALRDAKLRPFSGAERLDETLLNRCRKNRGVMMVEAVTPCTDPIRLEVKVDGETVFNYRPKLEFSMIDDMYRWHDIRGVADGTGGQSVSADLDPPGWPDAERDDSDFYFVHGYNVSDKEARQWGRAMFKRMWWSGMNSRFHVVSWFGSDSQFWVPLVGLVAPDYHVNVEHAFASAGALAAIVNRGGGRNYVAAHSLGNMLVSAAIQDHALKYERYFMLNAAVAAEAYDSRAVTEKSVRGMTPEAWVGIEDRFRASQWYRCTGMSPSDARRGLTWRNRFTDVGRAVNYYSSEEEVLQCDPSGEAKWQLQRDWAWYNQERLKGKMPSGSGRNEGGWGFNPRYRVLRKEVSNAIVYRDPTASEVNAVTDNLLEYPVFLPLEEESLMTGGFVAAIPGVLRAQLLADAIPAESFPAGFAGVPSFDAEIEDENVNMAARLKTNADTVYPDAAERQWGHSFFLDAPYMVVHGLFEDMVERMKGVGR